MKTKRLMTDRCGTSAVEFSLVAMLLFFSIFGIIDFSMAFWQWNSGEKATEYGVRRAAVSDPVATGLETFDCKTAAITWGTFCSDPGAATMPTILCDGAAQTCSAGYAFSAAAFTTIVARMRQSFRRLQPENVTVRYADSGLGFAGRPGGPVPAVTVCLQNMSFDMAIIDGLLGLGAIPMPEFCATLTAEDMQTAGT